MHPVIHALKKLKQIEGNIILPVYFGCYDHCKIAFCIGQVCRRYNDITSCRKPAKSADFLGIAVRNTAHQWLQVYKRSSLWFPAAIRHLQKRMQTCLPFHLFQGSKCFIPRTPQCDMVHLYSTPNTHSAVQSWREGEWKSFQKTQMAVLRTDESFLACL